MRSVLMQVCQSFTVVSNCIPGSPQSQVASAIWAIRSRPWWVLTLPPSVRARVGQAVSATTDSMKASVTRTELLEFWKKTLS